METKSISLIDGDEEIFYYSNISNFRVGSIKIETPKKIYKSFSPLSSNQKISFSNTIMIPLITNELNISKEKETEKLKQSPKKDNTRIKTESSKDENNTMSMEKQSTKLIIKNDIKENNDLNNHLTRNPYFLGKKNTFDITLNLNDNNVEIEEKKVKKFLKQSNNQTIPEKIKKNKHHRRQSCNIIIQNKLKNNIKRMESFDIIQLKDKKNLKNKIKWKQNQYY